MFKNAELVAFVRLVFNIANPVAVACSAMVASSIFLMASLAGGNDRVSCLLIDAALRALPLWGPIISGLASWQLNAMADFSVRRSGAQSTLAKPSSVVLGSSTAFVALAFLTMWSVYRILQAFYKFEGQAFDYLFLRGFLGLEVCVVFGLFVAQSMHSKWSPLASAIGVYAVTFLALILLPPTLQQLWPLVPIELTPWVELRLEQSLYQTLWLIAELAICIVALSHFQKNYIKLNNLRLLWFPALVVVVAVASVLGLVQHPLLKLDLKPWAVEECSHKADRTICVQPGFHRYSNSASKSADELSHALGGYGFSFTLEHQPRGIGARQLSNTWAFHLDQIAGSPASEQIAILRSDLVDSNFICSLSDTRPIATMLAIETFRRFAAGASLDWHDAVPVQVARQRLAAARFLTSLTALQVRNWVTANLAQMRACKFTFNNYQL